MSTGLSYEAFAAEIGVTRRTLYNWEAEYPVFAAAKKEAFDKCLNFWEKLGMSGILGKIKNFQASVYIFNMKNRFGWRDSVDVNADLQNITVKIDPQDDKL
jgi:DNA-binding XRE family transcriptional regulator